MLCVMRGERLLSGGSQHVMLCYRKYLLNNESRSNVHPHLIFPMRWPVRKELSPLSVSHSPLVPAADVPRHARCGERGQTHDPNSAGQNHKRGRKIKIRGQLSGGN